MAAWKLRRSRYVDERTDPRYVEYWDRLMDGLRKAGLPDSERGAVGGEIGKSNSYTLYAGSLDDPSAFHPTIAILAAGRPDWAIIPPGFKVFDRMPS